MYKQWDRVQTVDNDIGTVKFVGSLPKWGAKVVALGIEWDQPNRGKNNGDLNGVQYFTCDTDGAGSFIKSTSKKLREERYNFIQSLIHQYAGEENESILDETIVFGSKVAVSYGFHKLNKLQADFNNLKSVSLDKKLIYTSFDCNERTSSIISNLQNVEKLDLSYNLISDLNHVWEILDQLPMTKELNLNGNRFHKQKELLAQHHNLLSLKLASTNINIVEFLPNILQKLVSLTELSLAGNSYNDKCVDIDLNATHLQKLDLSFNNLTKLPRLIKQILSINLEQNQISDLDDSVMYNKITKVDLRNNKIADWSVIDKLNAIFPHLTDLRINGNPLFTNISVEEMTLNVIARCSVEKLNGSSLSKEEVENAELYFISKVRLGDYKYDIFSKRWRVLLQKYNIRDQTTVGKGKFQNKLSAKKITLNILSKELGLNHSRVFLVDNSVLKLKGIVCKLLQQSILNLKVHYYINEFEDGQEARIKQYLDDDIAILDNFGFYQQQNLYVSLIN